MARRPAAASRRARSPRSGDAWAGGDREHDAERRSRRCAPGASGTAGAADGRGGDSCSPAVPSAARSPRPAPRPARARRSTGATAASAWAGMDVSAAVASVNDTIAPALIGMAGDDQAEVDARLIALDGTPQKARLGGNATIAVSMAAGTCRRRGSPACRSGRIWPRAARTPCRCPRSRSSAAASTPGPRRHPGFLDRLPGCRNLRRGADLDGRGLPGGR